MYTHISYERNITMSLELRALVNAETQEVIGRVIFNQGLPKNQNGLICTITNQKTEEKQIVPVFVSNTQKYINQIKNPVDFMNESGYKAEIEDSEVNFIICMR